MNNKWKKNFPKCGSVQIFSNNRQLKKSIRLNRQCRKCMFTSKEYREKHRENSTVMWKSNKRDEIVSRRNSVGAMEKWRKSTISIFNSEEYLEKQRKIQVEYLKNNPEKNEENKKSIKNLWKNKNSVYHSEEYRKKLSYCVRKSLHKPDIRKKHLDALYSSKWIKVKTDVGQLELLEKWNKLGFNFEPNYQIKTDTDLFYLDGYDSTYNIVIEYDSKYHNRLGQREKDLIRQNKIINILNPNKFWRYDVTNKKFRNILERSS